VRVITLGVSSLLELRPLSMVGTLWDIIDYYYSGQWEIGISIFNLRLDYLAVYRHCAGQMRRLTLGRRLLAVGGVALTEMI